MIQEKWNNRYSSDEYFFGKEPNGFFKEEIDKLSPGRALFIGEGEGRNSVYASKLGWAVDAIDLSEVGKIKADKLAKENNVKICYSIGDAFNQDYPKNSYDAIFLIYFHIPKNLRDKFNSNLLSSLKTNGHLILIVYDEDHLKNNGNGPSDINMLYTLQEIAEDYIDLDFLLFNKETSLRTKHGASEKVTTIKFVGKKV